MSPEARSEALIEALPYIQQYRGQTFVIKYGGAAMEDEQIVDKFLRDVVFLEAVGINPVLVHGGGKAITSRMRDAGLQVTDSTAIKIVEETLDNEINPSIVSTINEFGGRAQGFSGKDVFSARRLDKQVVQDGELIDIGFVGEAQGVSIQAIKACVASEIVPVISPIGATVDGVVLNVNADIAAAALATQIGAAKLIFVTDVAGIMRDPAIKESLIPSVTIAQVESLIQQKIIAGGMIPKVRSATAALQQGVKKIHMVGGHIQHCLLLEIFTNAGIGTEIVP
ncbi:MAG: acetylglutamate kinase [Verrucomicrobia bacterium]|nr:acetylglutamate kinase [Verrucomicrobiota bacterium]